MSIFSETQQAWEDDSIGRLLAVALDWHYSDEFVGGVLRVRVDQIRKQHEALLAEVAWLRAALILNGLDAAAVET